MQEAIRSYLERVKVGHALSSYPGLRVIPSRNGCLTFVGDLDFHVQGPAEEAIQDSYAVKIRVPENFPRSVPSAWETDGRIPKDYHKMGDGSLCLGAPTEQRIVLKASPTIPTFIEKLLIPYLFGFSFYTAHGVLPYGELAHGEEGIRQFVASLFGCSPTANVTEFLRLASMRRRHANKIICPCGSGRRLGRCHHRKVNDFRKQMGRPWLRDEYSRMTAQEDDPKYLSKRF